MTARINGTDEAALDALAAGIARVKSGPAATRLTSPFASVPPPMAANGIGEPTTRS